MAMISPSESYLFGIKPSCLFGGGTAKLSLTDENDRAERWGPFNLGFLTIKMRYYLA